MAQLTRSELKNLIEGQDGPNHFTQKLIDSCMNTEDDTWIGTQAEYDALGTYDSDVFYFITE